MLLEIKKFSSVSTSFLFSLGSVVHFLLLNILFNFFPFQIPGDFWLNLHER